MHLKFIRSFALCLSLLLSFSLTAQNQAYYVSPDGNNGNIGTSLDNAWETIEHGLETIAPGDTLLVNDGIYVETNLRIRQRSVEGAPTVVKSINQWGAKIESRRQFATILSADSAAYVVIDGFEVYNPEDRPFEDWNSGIDARNNSHHIIIQNNYAHDCGCGGIGSRESDYLIIRRNVTRDNAKTNPFNCSGISIYQPTQLDDEPGTHILISENVCFENECRLPFSPAGFTTPTDGNGIILDDFNWTQNFDGDGEFEDPYTAEVIVENNLSFNNGGAGMKAFEVANAIFRNNTSVHNNLVLHEYTDNLGEIAAEFVIGDISFYNNLIVQTFGQQGYATHWSPKAGQGTLEVFNNIIVGDEKYNRAPEMNNNIRTTYDEQSFPRFAQIIPDDFTFTSVDDFRQFFGLRDDSPAIDHGDANLAPATDLTGLARPTSGAVNAGAFAGTSPGVGEVASDRVFQNDIPSTTIPVIVNGFKDPVYRVLPRAIQRESFGQIASTTDLDASWSATWDDENLYIFVQVSDNNLRNDSSDPSEDDGVEIFIDADNSRGDTYDGVNDFHYILGWNDVEVIERSRDAVQGVQAVQFSGFGNYSKEIAIPWATLGVTPSDNMLIGLDFWVNDDDTGGSLDGRYTWQDRENDAPEKPSALGNGRLVETPAPSPVFAIRDGESISVDGELEESWWGAPAITLNNVIDGSFDGEDDLTATWRAMWNSNFLYLYVSVIDDELRDNSSDYFNDDAVEFYLDSGLECVEEYDNNDRQLSVRWNENILFAQQGTLGQGVQTSTRQTDVGYDLEVRIPWSVININAEEGRLFGFDVHVTDDDNVSIRDGKKAWFGTSNESEENPSLFGMVRLAEGAPTATFDPAVATPLSAYPNPTEDLLTLDLPTFPQTITVTDLRGREVLRFTDTNTLRLGQLAAGSYVVTADVDGEVFRTVVVRR